MTELQQIEKNILACALEIVDRLHLTYFLVCGSALGAVKYNGFIPWDDDIDIAMPRKDYTVFCEKAGELLPPYLFLQNCHTEKNFPYIFSKIRDSRTTYIEKGMAGLDINHGVYIDVFPLDGYPVELKEQRWLEKQKLKHQLVYLSCLQTHLSLKVRMIVNAEKALGVPCRAAAYAKKFEKVISAYAPEASEYWCNHGNWQGKLEYAPREQYGEGYWTTFEGLRVRAPERYDEYLTQKYGDWRADLPLEQQEGHHYAAVIDLHSPFCDYIVKLGKGRIRLKSSEELKQDGIALQENYQF